MSTKDHVLALTDDHDVIYTITPELLELVQVHSDLDVRQIRALIAASRLQPRTISDVFPEIRVLGSYERSLDPSIKRDYYTSRLVVRPDKDDPANP